MKNIKTIIGLFIGLLVLGMLGYMETHHTQNGQVISVNQSNNNTLIKDNMGELWSVNTRDFNIGDNVKITFNNQATTIKEDDEIVKIEKL